MKREIARFLLALQFLTRIPVNATWIFSPDDLTKSVRYYPAVGLLIGACHAALFALAGVMFTHVIAIVITIVFGLVLTGAFHEDGLADTFDGIGGGNTRDNALEIMRDSRIGTYGTVALFSLLALKLGALGSLTASLVVGVFLAGHCLSRLSSVLVIASSQYVRDEGTGKPVAGTLSRISLVIAVGTGILVLAAWIVFLPVNAMLCGLAGLACGHFLMRRVVEAKLGGYTGDTLGAVQQCSEIGFYLGVSAWL